MQLHGVTSSLKSQELLSWYNIYPHFMKFKDSIPCSQEPTVFTAAHFVHSSPLCPQQPSVSTATLCPQQPTVFTATYCVHSNLPCSQQPIVFTATYRVHSSPAPDHVLNHMNPYHTLELFLETKFHYYPLIYGYIF
jgi:hypothetical protein